MPLISAIRRFVVRASQVDAHHARIVQERSFEAAAVTYIEDLHIVSDEAEMCVIVREIDSGHEHCFLIDAATGEVAPCG